MWDADSISISIFDNLEEFFFLGSIYYHMCDSLFPLESNFQQNYILLFKYAFEQNADNDVWCLS